MFRRRRCTALFFMGLALFSPPLLPAMNLPGSIGDLPLLPLYLYVSWAFLVVGAALVSRGADE